MGELGIVRPKGAAYIERVVADFAIAIVNDPLIKWKDSIKAVVGLARPATAGLDV